FSFQSCVCRVLITFITSNWKSYRLPIAAAIVNAQEGASLLVAAIVAYVADERLGRFKIVGYTTAAFITNILRGTATCNPGERWTKSNSESISQRSVWSEPELPSGRGRVSEPGKGRGSTPVLVVYCLVSWCPHSYYSFNPKLPIIEENYPDFINNNWSGFFVLCARHRCYSKEPPERKITLQIMNSWRRLVPFWITLLVYCLVEAAGTTFFLEQSDYLEYRIGNGFRIHLNYFLVLNSLTTFVTAGLVDFVTSKLCNKNQRKRAFVVRITLGMLVSFLCCITAWKVEVRRLKLIKEYGIPKSEVKKIPMSILWLTPQYLLLGIMGGLVEAGMEGCFYNLRVVGDESSTSHLDRYFLMLAMISLGSLAFFSVAAYACYWKIAPEEDVVGSNMELEEGLAQATPASSSGEPLGNPSSAKQLITQEFSTKRVLKGASSPPYFPLHGDSMATSGWNDVGRKSLRNRSFGNRVQKG
ncbi:hypothetical protein Gogos_008634, partial [Gossypium gossypioides]|nr:hypothetical protein [Gossypium gossypioides]